MSKMNPPDFKMTLGGVDFSDPEMAKRVIEIEVENIADGPDYFKVMLDDRDEYFAGGGKIKEGDSAKIALGYVNESCIDLIEGDVTGVESFRREYRRKVYVIRGFDGMHRLTRGRHRRSWLDMKDSDVAAQLAGEASLGSECDDSGIIHPYIFQNNVTNLSFLYERARRCGFEVDCHGATLRFKKPELSDPVCKLIWDESNLPGGGSMGNRLLKRCQFSTSTLSQVDEVTVRSWDPDEKKEIIGKSSDIHGSTMGGKKTGPQYAAAGSPSLKIQISDQPVRSVEEAEKVAYSILNQRASNFMTGFGASEGDGTIKAGKSVDVSFVGSEIDGIYYVARANHILKVGAGPGNGYTTEFEIRRTGH
ncbi:MAG: hypothetical protein AUK47_28550 [Deltaproteobacteria bacterium CG2_30_63_29]|nr:MAG: hypothetical protein AUK47_28550 [Deltaproteobacteria bacterium CG2_30_63_29]PIW02378.1 MAG: hypothetical protein COW42_02005 [Deltaproteobacteria bacterium CG17_big_fil_post_rev_8_21_14_2_50_63_7]PJB47641.1 MAG: hypothetical protein CO108_03870 [Deltaproteobacteria bacterium CG_4_9_14_3_um_filter_63_12]